MSPMRRSKRIVDEHTIWGVVNEVCQRSRKLFHGFCEGPSGGHGQNAYWHSASAKPEQAIQSWYDEVNKPGYDFKRHGFAKGTGHFTQVVWVDTRSVGMAVSKDGKYIVANCECFGAYPLASASTRADSA